MASDTTSTELNFTDNSLMKALKASRADNKRIALAAGNHKNTDNRNESYIGPVELLFIPS